MPEAHSAFRVQAVPGVAGATQLVPSHAKPLWQLRSPVGSLDPQLVSHAVGEAQLK